MLLVRDDECGPLLEQCLNRLSHKEVERKILAIPVANPQHILAQLAEVDLVDMDVLAIFAKRGNLRFLRMLSLDI